MPEGKERETDYFIDDRPEAYKPTETFDDMSDEEFDALYFERFGKHVNE